MVKRKPIPRLIDERGNIDVAESTNIYIAKVLADAKRVAMGLKQKFAHIIGDVTKLDIDSIVNAGKPIDGVPTDTPSTVSTIKIYVLSAPRECQAENEHGTQTYVKYDVYDVLDVEAGTTFGELKEIIASKGYDVSNIGVFNVDQDISDGSHSFVYQDNMSNTIVGVKATFPLKPGIKAGDVIDSRDYIVDSGEDFWNSTAYDRENSGYYQSGTSYQECRGYLFENDIVVEEGIAFIVHR